MATPSDTQAYSRRLEVRFPQRATLWRLARRELEIGRRPLLMGIVNVTPDSFSDGGKFFEPQAAIEHGLRLVAEGADLLDVGAESTRPYSQPVDVAEEWRRVLPVVEGLAAQVDVPVSIDTSKAAVAQAALSAGAEIVNDVSGLEGDSEMINVVLAANCGICAMHMQGNPQTMQSDPAYDDVVGEIRSYLAARLEFLQNAGVDEDRICLDPGIGFGKTDQHNLTLIAQIGQFHALGRPLLLGHSRKGFLAKLLADRHRDRAAATAGVALALAAEGVQIIRVHDVQLVHESLIGFEAVGGIDGQETVL